MNDFVFADIEIEPAGNQNGQRVSCDAVSARAIPIVPRAPDPIRERFYEMRKLSSQRPFPRNDSELFYKQARFMEDFEDSFGGNAGFNMYFPYYQRMGYDYLRTYFTWRTMVRKGDIQDTSLSYIFLYIYEVLSGIGVRNPEEGLCKLLCIWDTFAGKYDAVAKCLAKWFKDYHVYYAIPENFFDFTAEHNLQKYYSTALIFNTDKPGQLLFWNELSGYDITKSRFYRDGNEELLINCFDAVLAAIQKFCESKNAKFEDLLVYSVSSRRPWKPFCNALFYNPCRQPDREVYISKYERYYCRNNEWTASLPVYYSSQKDFIGYIIKKTEASLRAATGYKYKLSAEMKPGAKPFRELQRSASKRAELDRVIEHAVAGFYRDINRIVVEVDHKSLERIRLDALETQEQLIVDDGQDSAEDIKQMPDNPVFNQKPDENQMSQNATFESNLLPVTPSFADGWKQLAGNYTNDEKQALSLVLGGGDIKEFAQGKNIMLEVLLGGINEKASDCIGDSIIEQADDAVYIYDEYREYIKEMV